MPQFIFLLRNEAINFPSFAPEQYQKLLKDFDTWNAAMMKGRNLLASANLKDGTGRTLRQSGLQTQSDGPYCETKEAVAGFFLIEARDEDEALQFARQCPFLPLGGSVEVRPAQLEIEDYAAEGRPARSATEHVCE